MKDIDTKKVASDLFDALKGQYCLDPLTKKFPEISIEDAYSISLHLLEKRLGAGEHVIGKKIGVTSKVVQEMLGVHQPDFGFLTSEMQIPNKSTVSIKDLLIQPRAEGEIAFMLSKDLQGPGINAEDVLDSTEYIFPCFEIVDSRIINWKIAIQDTIADNASCGIFVLGDDKRDPHELELDKCKLKVYKNGNFLSQGQGSAVQGHPCKAIAWLANTLGEFNIPFKAGEIILSGSLVPLEPVVCGDEMYLELEGVGSAEIKFI